MTRLLFPLLALGLLGLESLYIVDETEQIIVTQFQIVVCQLRAIVCQLKTVVYKLFDCKVCSLLSRSKVLDLI